MYYLFYERPLFSIVAFILKHSLKWCDINALYMSDQDMEAAAEVIEGLSVRLFGYCQYIQCKKMQTIILDYLVLKS